MRNNPDIATRTGDAPGQSPNTPKHVAARAHLRRALGAVLDWLRAGYPDEAPRRGHSPLLALNGPLALTPRQRDCVINELAGQRAADADIQVAITKVTDQLPTPTQVRAISANVQKHVRP